MSFIAVECSLVLHVHLNVEWAVTKYNLFVKHLHRVYHLPELCWALYHQWIV